MFFPHFYHFRMKFSLKTTLVWSWFTLAVYQQVSGIFSDCTKSCESSRIVAELVGGGGGWKTLCIKIGYSEPRGAERREVSSTLAENSRVFLGDVILDFDWLTTRVAYYSISIGWRSWRVLSCSILIGWRSTRVFRARFWLAADNSSVLGMSWVCSAVYKDREWAEWLIFVTVRLFRETFLELFSRASAWIIITARTKFDARG